MEQLTSCYFCGDAVDAAIEEYPLVRSRAFPDVDTDRRITLCPSCRRKLTQVIEEVLEAAFEGGESGGALAADRLRDVEMDSRMTASEVESVENGPEPLAGAAEASAPESEEPESEEDWATAETPTGGEGVADAGSEATDAGEEADVTEADGSADDSSTKAEGTDTESEERVAAAGAADTAEMTDDEGTGTESDDEDTETAFETAAGAEETTTEQADETDTEGESSATDAADTDDAAETSDAAASEGDQQAADESSEGDDADDSERQYTKSEFNKVVRLLQNREFPVEIDELVVVAGSAYEIDEPTCHAIVDALIERGVVEDNGEELVRP